MDEDLNPILVQFAKDNNMSYNEAVNEMLKMREQMYKQHEMNVERSLNEERSKINMLKHKCNCYVSNEGIM